MNNNIDIISNQLTEEIRDLILIARNDISQNINKTLLNTYWNIGKAIVEKEQLGNIRAEYGKEIWIKVSKKLTQEMGKGFSKSNLFNMKRFYLTYSKIPDASGILSWSHYCELMTIKEEEKRNFYLE